MVNESSSLALPTSMLSLLPRACLFIVAVSKSVKTARLGPPARVELAAIDPAFADGDDEQTRGSDDSIDGERWRQLEGKRYRGLQGKWQRRRVGRGAGVGEDPPGAAEVYRPRPHQKV
ncbi:unnamed protein product [Ectocarpus sp. CCAP 1310/34]|nr:unnamed protein product [Ectocarpus sp. CCAP 1310/34]